MQNWFTVEKIASETYVISENKHWEETHCYLVCGSEKAVLIDTGLGIANIKEVVDKLTNLPVQVLTTHIHWDHIGGHKYFENIAVHEKEVEWLESKFPLPLEIVRKNLMAKSCGFPDEFSIENYTIFQGKANQILIDGDVIDLGNRKLQVIHTPGHSPGHCCYYETDRKYLYSGDLIYKGCLDAFYPTTDPQLFKESVEKITSLEIKRILPGHHELNISPELVYEIQNAFCKLEKEGNLVQGKGIFDFEKFQIHI